MGRVPDENCASLAALEADPEGQRALARGEPPPPRLPKLLRLGR